MRARCGFKTIHTMFENTFYWTDWPQDRQVYSELHDFSSVFVMIIFVVVRCHKLLIRNITMAWFVEGYW